MAKKRPPVSGEAIATAIGVTVIQTLEFTTGVLSLNSSLIQQYWAPFLAATTRSIGQSNDANPMVDIFKYASKNDLVSACIQEEIISPDPAYYKNLNSGVVSYINTVGESLYEVGYEPALKTKGILDKDAIFQDLVDMYSHYFFEQKKPKNSKNIGFINVVAMASTQYIEDLYLGLPSYTLAENSRIMETAKVIFASGFVFYTAGQR